MTAKMENHKRMYLCAICGKLIEGNEIRVQTRRRSDHHYHPECIKRENEKNRLAYEMAARASH